MADIKEEVLIDVKLEQEPDAFSKLSRLKGSILNLKQEQKDLSKAYKEGKITQKEFTEELVRVEAVLKKTSAEYNKVQRSVTGLKSPFDELGESLRERTKEFEVGGLSIGKLLNPITAVTASLGALYEFYEKSTIGAKDLEFVSTELSSATRFLANDFASLFSSAEDGQGFFSKITTGFLVLINASLGARAHLSGMLKEEFDQNRRDEQQIRADMAARLEANQGDLTIMMQKQATTTKEFNEQMDASSRILANLEQNQKDIVAIKTKQLETARSMLALDSDNEALKENELNAEKELNRERARAEKLIQNQQRAEDNLRQTFENYQKAASKAAKKAADDALGNLTPAEFEEFQKAVQRVKDEDAKRAADKADLDKIRHDNFLAQWKEQVAAVQEANAQMDESAQEAFEKDKKRKQQQAVFSQVILEEFSANFQQQLKLNQDFQTALMKSTLVTLLHAFKKYIELKILGESFATLDSIATFGLSGAIRSAIILGALEAAFSGFESVIEGFAEGGRPDHPRGKVMPHHGIPIRRANGDDRLVTMKTREAVITEEQQRRLGGPRALAAAGVPGFAGGGSYYGVAETRAAFTNVANDILFQKMIDAVQARQVAVVIEDIESVSAQRIQIRSRASL